MVDGILMIPALREGEHIEKIRGVGIPIVLLDRKIPGLEVDYVMPDNYKSGYDDIDQSSIFIPSLTTIHYPVKDIVNEVSRILLARIKQPIFTRNKEIIIKPELVIRESTKARQ